MDVHPDAKLPLPSRQSRVGQRVDAVKIEGDATIAQLRARLLKLIVEQERSRGRSSNEPNKPR